MESNIESSSKINNNSSQAPTQKQNIINLEKFSQTKEEDVGITEYMCPENPGFKCVLKHRYSDFICDTDFGHVFWRKIEFQIIML